MPLNDPLSHEQVVHAEKRRRIGKESHTHGPTSEVTLVDVDLVVFGRFEIKPWYPSPYVLDPLEYHQATSLPPQPSSDSHPTITSSKSTSSQAPDPGYHVEDDQSSTPGKKRKKVLSKNIPTSPLHYTLVNIQQEKLIQASDRSQTPDSLSSLDTGSAPLDPSTNQSSLIIPKDAYPSSVSDLVPTSPYQPLPTKRSNDFIHQSDPILPSSSFLKLYVCDGCLKYSASLDCFRQHKLHCKVTHPPGRKVYQSGQIIIREVDGSKAKLYCQCLCLFGKLFIDHKYIFFDVEGFKFYILTVEENLISTLSNVSRSNSNSSHCSSSNGAGMEMGMGKQKRETIMGFFSKEKFSYDGYNLACIVTLPPYQKKGYGTLLIAFSYELDRFEGGGRDENGLPKQENLYLGTPERPLSHLGAKGYLSHWTAVLVRFFRTLFPPPPPRIHQGFHSTNQSNQNNYTCVTSSNHDQRSFNLTLEEISRSTRLRPDDVAFALISSGLTKFGKQKLNNNQHDKNLKELKNDLVVNDDDDREEQVIIITRDLVEQVAKRSKVKSAILDPRHILINYTNFNNVNNDNNHQNHHLDQNHLLHQNHHQDDHQLEHFSSNSSSYSDFNFDQLSPPLT